MINCREKADSLRERSIIFRNLFLTTKVVIVLENYKINGKTEKIENEILSRGTDMLSKIVYVSKFFEDKESDDPLDLLTNIDLFNFAMITIGKMGGNSRWNFTNFFENLHKVLKNIVDRKKEKGDAEIETLKIFFLELGKVLRNNIN